MNTSCLKGKGKELLCHTSTSFNLNLCHFQIRLVNRFVQHVKHISLYIILDIYYFSGEVSSEEPFGEGLDASIAQVEFWSVELK